MSSDKVNNLKTILSMLKSSEKKTPMGWTRQEPTPARANDRNFRDLIWNPDYEYYERHPDKKDPHSLVKPILARFPDQPKWPAYNQALNYDHSIARTLKGNAFFISQLYRHDIELAEVAREEARVARDKRQSEARDWLMEKDSKLYDDKYIRYMFARMRSVFKYRAERTEQYRQLYLQLKEKTYQDAQKTRQLLSQIKDEDTERAHRVFWEEVEKNLEKKPVQKNFSGTNMQTLLNALSEEEYPSRIISAMRRVEDNILRAFASQIAGHMNTRSVPIEIYYETAMKFNRMEFEKELKMQSMIDRANANAEAQKLERNLHDRDQVAYRKERIVDIEDRIDAYWSARDKAHETIQASLVLSGVNMDKMRRMLNYMDGAYVFNITPITLRNLNHLHANNIIEHADGLQPGILTPWAIRINYLRFIADREIFYNYLDTIKDRREDKYAYYEYNRLWREDIKDRLEDIKERIEDYWRDWDFNHQTYFRPINTSVTNLTEMTFKMMKGEFSQIKLGFADAKFAVDKLQKYQLNQHTQTAIPGLRSFEKIAFRPKEKILEDKIKSDLEASKIFRGLHDEVKLQHFMKAMEDQAEFLESLKPIKIPISSMETSENSLLSRMRYLRPAQVLFARYRAYKNRNELHANSLIERSGMLNDIELIRNASPHKLRKESFQQNISLTPYESTHKITKKTDNKLSDDTSFSIDKGVPITPNKDPDPGKNQLRVIKGEQKTYLLIDTYHKNENGNSQRNTPQIEVGLAGFEDQYIKNGPGVYSYEQPLPNETPNHYEDVIKIYNMVKARKP